LIIKTKHMRAGQEYHALDSLVFHVAVFLFNCVSPRYISDNCQASLKSKFKHCSRPKRTRKSLSPLIAHMPNIMRSTVVLVGVLSALIMAMPAMGQDVSDPLDLNPDSELVATDTILAFLDDAEDKNTTAPDGNESLPDGNESLPDGNESLPDGNESLPEGDVTGTPSLDEFLDQPINKTTLETKIGLTSSQAAFLGLPDPTEAPEFVKGSAGEETLGKNLTTQDTKIGLTSSQAAFLGLPDPTEAPEFVKGSAGEETLGKNLTTQDTKIGLTPSQAAFLGLPDPTEAPKFIKGSASEETLGRNLTTQETEIGLTSSMAAFLGVAFQEGQSAFKKGEMS